MNFTTFLIATSLVASEPALIRRSARAPNLETPVAALDQLYTPNELFFQRWHLAGIAPVAEASWSLKVHGDSASKELKLSLAQLKDPKEFEQVEMAAVAVCAGNRRGLFDPHVPGVQWGHGAMGNARWKGVRLRDILQKAGVKPEAVEVVFDGADVPVWEKTPDFRKSLPLGKAMHADTLVAYEMNGAPLPAGQGFPARVVVPGWVSTYWVKQLVDIEVRAQPFDGYWMKTAYRIPRGKFSAVETTWPGQTTDADTPITEIIVNSVVTRVHQDKGRVEVAGFAWDGGHGISKVEVSLDGGKRWQPAKLEEDVGKYSWRRFRWNGAAPAKGKLEALARATNGAKQTQPADSIANPAGYHNNAPQPFSLAEAKSSAGEAVQLKPGPGQEKVAGRCGMCHSLDYIEMNSFLDKQGWEKTVDKMITAYGAPIPKPEVSGIVDYLASRYGRATGGQ